MTKAGVGSDAKLDQAAKESPFCRCEATISSAILEGYACGNPACWRTPVVQASFDTFVADLIRTRGELMSPHSKAADGNTAADH